jgi:hypothetical protein
MRGSVTSLRLCGAAAKAIIGRPDQQPQYGSTTAQQVVEGHDLEAATECDVSAFELAAPSLVKSLISSYDNVSHGPLQPG